MLVWGVEASELSALAGCFPCYDAWTKVSCQQPDLLLTNAMAVIESEEVPQLPPRLHALDQARRLGNTLAGHCHNRLLRLKLSALPANVGPRRQPDHPCMQLGPINGKHTDKFTFLLDINNVQ